MATHGRSGLGRALLRRVADRVLRSSPVPVLLLHRNQHRATRLRTLLVPVDGTPGGALALATAVSLARNSGARLVLVRATVPLPLWRYEPTLGLNTEPLIDPMWDEDARQPAAQHATARAVPHPCRACTGGGSSAGRSAARVRITSAMWLNGLTT